MKRAFRGGARSETLKPDPVTELPLTPPAEEDEEEAAISFLVGFSLHSAVLALSPTAPPPGLSRSGGAVETRTAAGSRPTVGGVAGALRSGDRASGEGFRVLIRRSRPGFTCGRRRLFSCIGVLGFFFFFFFARFNDAGL